MDDGEVEQPVQMTSIARDRPEGQAKPEPVKNWTHVVSTKVIAGVVASIGVTIWALSTLLDSDSPDLSLWTTAILFVMSIVSAVFPLQIAFKEEMEFDLAVIVAAALLVEPQWSIPVIVLGYLIGYAIRYRLRIDVDCPFNAGVMATTLGTSGLLVQALDWDFLPNDNSIWRIIGLGAIVSLIYLVVSRVSVAIVVQSQSRQPWRHILRDSTLGMQVAEQAMLGAMIALGVIGVIVAGHSPFGLLLLIAPAFALWLALRQHIETRHRIEASLTTAQEVAGIGSLDWDLTRGDIRWSEILFQILGYDAANDRASTVAYVDRVHDDDQSRVIAAFQAAADGNEIEIDHRVTLPDGGARTFNLKFSGVPDRHQRIKRIVGTIHDVTDRKRLEAQLHFQAYHDPLTLLPNRAMFLQRLEQSFARYARTSAIALLFLDLDRFKLINDTMGHETGDQLLRTVARRLEECLRPNDIVARLGGDEFICLLDNINSMAEATVVAERILAEIDRPVPISDSRDVSISASIGIVRPLPVHETSADLLRDADIALYQAKEKGRNGYAIFEPAMNAETRTRLEIEADLRHAIERNQFSLVYQPRFEMTTGRVSMIEVLVRWKHPERGEVSPSRFIPIVEETGLSESIGNWILATALAETTRWSRSVIPPPPVSVNITRRQLLSDGFVPNLLKQLRIADIPPRQLRIELSEIALMSNREALTPLIAELRSLGILTSIDDFGTGHASLNALRSLPVDMLLLDHQFVAELGTAKEATTVAQAVIGLAHGLGLAVIAEGVETAAQAAQLFALGCEFAQGHFFCSPMPAAELITYLAHPPHLQVESPTTRSGF